MNRRRVLLVGAAVLVIAGGLIAVKLTQPSRTRLGAPIYTVPAIYQSTGVSSNHCSGTVWTDANSVSPSLTTALRALAPNTEVDFATDGCYEIEGGLDGFCNTSDSCTLDLSYDGNPSGIIGENAEIFDSDIKDDGFDQDSNKVLRPIIQEAGSVGVTIEHFFLKGSDTNAGQDPNGYSPDLSEDGSAIQLLGTDHTIVNDILTRATWGDGLIFDKLSPSNHYIGTNTNVTAMNYTVENTGRQGISPVSVKGALLCGISIGPSSQDNSLDYENDTVGPGQGAQNVKVTGLPCSVNGATAQGCYFDQRVIVNTNPAQSGNDLIDDCQGFQATGASGAVQDHPGGSTGSAQIQGPVTFSNDQILCGTAGPFACFDIDGPMMTSVRGSLVNVGTSNTFNQVPWAAYNNSITDVPGVIPPRKIIAFIYKIRNTGTDKLTSVSATGSFCGTSTFTGSSNKDTPTVNDTLDPGQLWTFECDKEVDTTVTDTMTAHATDPTTSVTLTGVTAYTVNIGFPAAAKAPARLSVATNMSETTDIKVPYSGTLYLASDCFTGFMSDAGNTPPFGRLSGAGTYTRVNTTFNPGTRGACQTTTSTDSTPSATPVSLSHTHVVTDTATVTGMSGPGQPAGLISFYQCGPSSQPQACTSKTSPVGSSQTLVAATGANAITSSATSSNFTPTMTGWYCFGAYYLGHSLTGGGAYKPSSDTSGWSTVTQPSGVEGLPYDGCVDVTA